MGTESHRVEMIEAMSFGPSERNVLRDLEHERGDDLKDRAVKELVGRARSNWDRTCRCRIERGMVALDFRCDRDDPFALARRFAELKTRSGPRPFSPVTSDIHERTNCTQANVSMPRRTDSQLYESNLVIPVISDIFRAIWVFRPAYRPHSTATQRLAVRIRSEPTANRDRLSGAERVANRDLPLIV
jgi:hypothetical protein